MTLSPVVKARSEFTLAFFERELLGPSCDQGASNAVSGYSMLSIRVRVWSCRFTGNFARVASAASLGCAKYERCEMTRLLVAEVAPCHVRRGTAKPATRRLKETRMKNTAGRSLRMLVENWLRPTAETPIRITRFSRAGPNRGRYVRVEALRPDGPVALFFFRHDDGTWHVLPPDARQQ